MAGLKRHPLFRVGHGYDLHRLEAGLPLWLGGLRIESDRGAAAHSDGDVVLHAVTDAVLGAVGSVEGGGDIGDLFPDDDERWRGAASRVFVEEAVRRVREAGYAIGNLDVTVVLERPRLAGVKWEMARSLATMLGCDTGRVNVKAKTREGMDAVGEGRAVECWAVALLERLGDGPD